ncbi:Gfo/Idh/MocA family oxidoreductase [bacterium]|nr:Gfo/Idh/MocA family oxidoreductase [bacterium]
MKKLKVGVIGCGRVGSLLERDPLRHKPCSHAGAFAACPDTEVTCACDIDPDKLKQFREDWGVERLYLDYRELLAKERPQIISVASWTSTHKDIVVEAANCGVKVILCEKPISLSLARADVMIQECRNNKVALLVNHERRWDQRFLAAKQLIDDGEIGTLRSIRGAMLCGIPETASWKSDLSLVGGGPLLHDGTHLFDMIRFFGGEVKSIVGFVHPNERLRIEDWATAILQLENGVQAYVEVGGQRSYFHFAIEFWGANGKIAIGNGINDLFVSQESKSFYGFRELAPREFPLPESHKSSYLAIAEDIVRLKRGSCENRSSGEDARGALEIIWGIYESERLSNSIVTLPLTRREVSPLMSILKRKSQKQAPRADRD